MSDLDCEALDAANQSAAHAGAGTRIWEAERELRECRAEVKQLREALTDVIKWLQGMPNNPERVVDRVLAELEGER